MPETRPATILITRPEPGASETAARLMAAGMPCLITPSLVIAPRPVRLPAAGAIAAVLVTSANALAPCLPDHRDTPMITVGDATARKAEMMGFTQVTSAAGDAVALAELVVRTLQPSRGPLLLVCGQGQGAPLATTLRGRGFRVVRRVAYASLPAPTLTDEAIRALRAGRVRAALFFSAETARVFVRLVRRAGLTETMRPLEALAIGGTTAVALQGLPWRHVGVAAKPTQDAMLALLS